MSSLNFIRLLLKDCSKHSETDEKKVQSTPPIAQNPQGGSKLEDYSLANSLIQRKSALSVNSQPSNVSEVSASHESKIESFVKIFFLNIS